MLSTLLPSEGFRYGATVLVLLMHALKARTRRT
jgi:hypothetical protein